MLPILKKIKKPRKLKTGRFDTRLLLIEFLEDKYYNTPIKQADLARLCQVSETTVANILESQELRDYRHFKDLKDGARPKMIIWKTDKVDDRIVCQTMAEYAQIMAEHTSPLFKVEQILSTGHPVLMKPDQAQKLYDDYNAANLI